MQCNLYGRGYYVFLFEKEDRDLFIRSGSFFIGPRRMYLNLWNLDFDTAKHVPYVVLVWVNIPCLHLHCCSDEDLSDYWELVGELHC